MLLDELEVLVGADHRPRVAGKRHDREQAEDGVDRAALEPELAQMRTGQERTGRLEQLGGGGTAQSLSLARAGAVRRRRWWWWGRRLELELLGRNTRDGTIVADQTHLLIWPQKSKMRA